MFTLNIAFKLTRHYDQENKKSLAIKTIINLVGHIGLIK